MTAATPLPVTIRTGGSNTWATPRDFLEGFVAALGLPPITLDVAAEPLTTVCDDYFGPGGRLPDALVAEWRPLAPGLAFVNPPYSRTCRSCPDRVWKGKRLPDGGVRPVELRCRTRGHQSSTITDWAARASLFGCAGQPLAMLAPARVDTDWFHNYVLGRAAKVCLIHGRHRFLTPNQAGELVPYKDPAAFPTMLAFYDGAASTTEFIAMRPNGRVG